MFGTRKKHVLLAAISLVVAFGALEIVKRVPSVKPPKRDVRPNRTLSPEISELTNTLKHVDNILATELVDSTDLALQIEEELATDAFWDAATTVDASKIIKASKFSYDQAKSATKAARYTSRDIEALKEMATMHSRLLELTLIKLSQSSSPLAGTAGAAARVSKYSREMIKYLALIAQFHLEGASRRQLSEYRKRLSERIKELQGKNIEATDLEWEQMMEEFRKPEKEELHRKFLAHLKDIGIDPQEILNETIVNASTASPSVVSSVARGASYIDAEAAVYDLSLVPGINPDAIAALYRCNWIAETMTERFQVVRNVCNQCPKGQEGEPDPPCPPCEDASVKNRTIDRESITCNKESNGAYIPFFGSSNKTMAITPPNESPYVKSALGYTASFVPGATGVDFKLPAAVVHTTGGLGAIHQANSCALHLVKIREADGPSPRYGLFIDGIYNHDSVKRVWPGDSDSWFHELEPGHYCLVVGDYVLTYHGFTPIQVDVKQGFTTLVRQSSGILELQLDHNNLPWYCEVRDANGAVVEYGDPSNRFSSKNAFPPGMYSYECNWGRWGKKLRGSVDVEDGKLSRVLVR